MYINYDISEINENSSGITVKVRFFEGDYEDVERENELGELETVNVYVRKNFLSTLTHTFTTETSRKDIYKWLKDKLSEDTEREPLWT
jgi:hypothetical protein